MILRQQEGRQQGRRQQRGALSAGLAAAVLACLLTALPASAEPADSGAADARAVDIELNKLEANGEACRAYLVVKNASPQAFDSLKLDLVMFDTDGVVARRLAVEAAPLPPGKTSLKVFDIAGYACDGIGSVLLNDVLACAPAVAGDCLGLVAASARGEVPFIK